MYEIFELELPEDAALGEAARVLSEGALVVLPTDTVYGIGARPDVAGAAERLFEAKRRPLSLTVPVLVADAEDAGMVGELDDRARTLAERFWPGGLTIVLPRSGRARSWKLGEERDTVGVRVPDHPVALALLARSGPLAVTSANLSGEPTPQRCEEVIAVFGDEVAVYLCAGPSTSAVPSTIVDLSGPEAVILREGALPAARVLGALG